MIDKTDPDADTVGVEGSMRYLGDLGVQLDEPVLLAVLTDINAPTMGEMTRQGFLDGWKSLKYHSPPLFPNCLSFPPLITDKMTVRPTYPPRKTSSAPTAATFPHLKQTSSAEPTNTPSASRSPPARKPSPLKTQPNTGASFSHPPRSTGIVLLLRVRRLKPNGWICGWSIWRRSGRRVCHGTCGSRWGSSWGRRWRVGERTWGGGVKTGRGLGSWMALWSL